MPYVVGPYQGCQMVYFQTENPNLDQFWRVLQWKMLVYFMDIWSILWTFGLFYGHFGLLYGHLVILPIFYGHTYVLWSILRPFGKFCGHFV
jgi:hypothetical protein